MLENPDKRFFCNVDEPGWPRLCYIKSLCRVMLVSKLALGLYSIFRQMFLKADVRCLLDQLVLQLCQAQRKFMETVLQNSTCSTLQYSDLEIARA